MEGNNNRLIGDATKARFISAIIDNLIALLLTLLAVGAIPGHLSTLRATLLVTVYLGYYFVLEALWSRTLGKYFQGLIVRKLNGEPGDWKTALIRTLLRIVEVNPILFGAIPAGLILIISERKQRLGDMLAGSVVVSDKLKSRSDRE